MKLAVGVRLVKKLWLPQKPDEMCNSTDSRIRPSGRLLRFANLLIGARIFAAEDRGQG